MNDKELSALKALAAEMNNLRGFGPDDFERLYKLASGTYYLISRLEQAEAGAISTDVDMDRRHQEASDKLFSATGTKLAAGAAGAGEVTLPKWIDDLKGRDPLIDDLITYIIDLAKLDNEKIADLRAQLMLMSQQR